jgi:hypothetical protein
MTNEGVLAFWKGLPFAWGRELSYTSVKLGACEFLRCEFKCVCFGSVVVVVCRLAAAGSWICLQKMACDCTACF